MPARTAGRATSQPAKTTGRVNIAARTGRIPGIPEAGSPGVASTRTASAAASAATAQKTISGPVTVAIPPITGPSRMPKIAAARAAPIISPRRSAGAAVISQARPPVHAQAPPTPSANRATSSTTALFANANATLETAIRARPTSIACRDPIRAARKPEGSAATSVPAAYEALSTPAAVFDSPRSSAYSGSSGVIAA